MSTPCYIARHIGQCRCAHQADRIELQAAGSLWPGAPQATRRTRSIALSHKAKPISQTRSPVPRGSQTEPLRQSVFCPTARSSTDSRLNPSLEPPPQREGFVNLLVAMSKNVHTFQPFSTRSQRKCGAQATQQVLGGSISKATTPATMTIDFRHALTKMRCNRANMRFGFDLSCNGHCS